MISYAVETVTFEIETWLKLRDWDFINNLDTRDFKNLCILPNFLKCRHCLWVEFFSSFWHFSDWFCLFLTWKYNKQKLLYYRNFTLPFLCNIHSFETCTLWDCDENRNLRDRDSQKWVSRRFRDRNQFSRLHHWWLFMYTLVLQQSYHVSNYSSTKYKNKFRIDRVESWTKLIFETFLLLVYFNAFWLYFCFIFIFLSWN